MADQSSISLAQPAVTTPAADSARRLSSPWIVTRSADLAWIVGAPALVLIGISLAKLHWSGQQITSFALIFAIGHHLPGMMRAYGDRALFARFRWRFVLAPAALIALCVYASINGFTAVALATGMWGWWHYLMQTYGFARIYDCKAGSLSLLTRRLDHAMCLVWFAAPLVLTPNGMLSYTNQLARIGGPVIPAEGIVALRTAVIGGVLVVTTLFTANLLWQWVQGRPPSPMKLALMGTTFAYYWYSLATVDNILVSYALFELFHDVQYLAIVWAFNRSRIQKGVHVGGFTRFLFRQRIWLVGLYVLCVAVYGLLNHFARELSWELARDGLIGVFAASTLLHYYYDGFIWKLREPETRRPLGIDDGAPAVPAPAIPRPARHALLWLLLSGAVVGLLVWERQNGGITAEKLASVVAALPDSPLAHHHMGLALAAEQRPAEAIACYRRSIALNPNIGEVHYNLGAALLATGKERQACDEFRRTLELIPNHAASHYNLAVSLQRAARTAEAERHYRAAVEKASPIEAEARHALATLLEQRSQLDDAAAEELSALRLNPRLTAALIGLAQIRARQGLVDQARSLIDSIVKSGGDSFDFRIRMAIAFEKAAHLGDAETQYRLALRSRPDSANVTNSLGVVLARQKRLREATEIFRLAIQLDPTNHDAQLNLRHAQQILASDASR